MNKKIVLLLLVIVLSGIVRAQEGPQPGVTISADITAGTAPLTVKFTSTIDDPFAGKYPVTYDWYFDDGAASTEKNPTHTFIILKTYTVICKVTFWRGPKIIVQDTIEINVTSLWPAAVCTAVYHQTNPQITSDGSGGAIITWDDRRSGNADIYAQRVDITGKLLWTADGVATCTAANSQEYPQIIYDGSGGAIITWQDMRSGNYDIYAQRIDSEGKFLWTAGGVPICTAVFHQYEPQIISDGSNGAVITWNDNRHGSGAETRDIYAQRIDSTGKCLWTADGVAICTATGEQRHQQITSDGSGGAIITWSDERNVDVIYARGVDIYAQRIDSTGIVLWPADGAAICTSTQSQYGPQITSDGSGGAIITWWDYRSGNNNDIYAQRIGSTGNPLWAADGAVVCAAANHQKSPRLTSDGFGGAVITWYDSRSGNWDIYAQRIDSTGKILWAADGAAICTLTNHQYYPQLTSDGSGGAVITWWDSRSGNYDIYARRIDSAGTPLWIVNGVAISTAANDQTNPQITSDGSGSAIITWQDGRSGNYDIYAQRITKDGKLE